MNLILFDVSGTLVHSNAFENKVLWKTLTQVLSIPMKSVCEFRPEETETAFVKKVWNFVRGGEPTREEWDEIYAVYQRILTETYLLESDRFKAVLGAPELLRHLQTSKSWGFAIATTSWHDLAHMSLRGSGFYTRRFHVVTGEGVLTKVDLVNKAIESSKRWYGVSDFEKVTYVGDGSVDTKACRELNLPYLDVTQVAQATQKSTPCYPSKTQFIRLARRAAVPSRIRENSFVSLMGLKT